MPKASAREIVARQWEILKSLPSRSPGRTCAEIREHLALAGHEVGKRTVERDMVALSGTFSLVCDDALPAPRWRWRDGQKLETGGLTVADALSLALAEQTIRPLLPTNLLRAVEPRFALARTKLAELGQQAHARWLDTVRSVPASLTFAPPRVPAAVITVVHEALFHETCLEVDYSNPSARRAKTQLLHPLGLVQRGPVTYLVASAYDYDEPLLYALHRISRATRLPDPRRVPPGFSLDAFLAAGNLDFAPGAPVRLKARLGDALAGYLTETPLAADQKITGRVGHYQLTATVRDSWQLRFWILSQGPEITVLSPAALRKEILNTIRETSSHYAASARMRSRS